jgi:hypothetical protein
VTHYESLRRLLKNLAHELIESDRELYGELDADRLREDYMVILGGAIALSEIYHDLWPVRQGMEMVEHLIEKKHQG